MIEAMLASPSKPNQEARLLGDEQWTLEQKMDGHRVLLQVETGGKITAYNRRGEVRDIPAKLRERLTAIHADLRGTLVYDGELMDGYYAVFDLIDMPKINIRKYPHHARRGVLEEIIRGNFAEADELRLVPIARTPAEKQAMFEACQDKEGVIFKSRNSLYVQRRSLSWIKHKFVKTCDVVVMGLNRKGKAESMTIGLYDEHGSLRETGGCRILPRFAGQIDLGDVVEVRYLYATEDNKLYQPVLVHLRPDKKPEECGLWQTVRTNKQLVSEGS